MSQTTLSAVPLLPKSMRDVVLRVRALEPDRKLDDVAQLLLEIERERDGYRNPNRGRLRSKLRKAPDGVACFNFMYLTVTEAVRDSLGEFEDPVFVERLAVVFAEFYFAAYEANEHDAWVSKAWAPLFEGAKRRDVAPVQYALAGMNAHINNDLPWALWQTWDELGDAVIPDSPRYRDFQRVNDILEEKATLVRSTLESGFWRWLNRILGRFDDIVASVVIAKARTDAWQRAARWRRRFDEEAADAHERHVGYESHLILAV